MSLLNKASLVLTPNAVKENKLYSIIPTNGDGDMSVVRATAATRVNSLGLIQNVSIATPRLDYTNATCPSILLEPQRTNSILRSEEFANASWLKVNSTVIENTATSPSGTLTADTFSDTVIGVSTYTLAQQISYVSGTTYSVSLYVKNIDRNYIYIRFVSTVFGTNKLAYFNVQNGSLISADIGVTASIIDMGNGWYRCIATSTSTASATTNSGCVIGLSDTGARFAYTNTSVKSVYIWGVQLEVGSYPTSYIPTSASIVTRNADVITRNNIYTNGLITSAGGTWFVELDNNFSLTRDTGSSGLVITDSITEFVGNSFEIRDFNTTSSRIQVIKRISGTATMLYSTLTNNVKIAIKWNGVSADIFVNGIKVVSATSFATTNMEFLNGSGTDVPKYIKSQLLFPTPLSDSECIQLTTL